MFLVKALKSELCIGIDAVPSMVYMVVMLFVEMTKMALVVQYPHFKH